MAVEKLTYEPLSGRLYTITDAIGTGQKPQIFPRLHLWSQAYSNLAPGTVRPLISALPNTLTLV